MKKKITLLPDISGLLSFALFAIMVFFAGGRALLDGDTLWHIKAGSIMIERGEILTHDIFSHTQYGVHWTAHEWLAEIIMGAIHHQFGLSGVVIFYFLLVALSFWLLFHVAKLCGAGDFLSLLVVSLAFFLAMSHLLARPHIFTWFFGILTLYLLLKNNRSLYFLPPIMIIWANLHGGFVLGLFLQGIFLLGHFFDEKPWSTPGSLKTFFSRNKTPILTLILSTLATGLNPFGYHQLFFPFHVSNSFYRKVVLEWFAPNLQNFWELRYYILVIIFGLSFNKAKISWTNRLFLLFFLNAALTHVRHISIAGIFLTPFNIEFFRSFNFPRPTFFDRKGADDEIVLSKTSGILTTVIIAIILMSLGTWNFPPWQQAEKKLFPLPKVYSASAIEYLKASPPKGNMYNYDSLGDYLIYTMGPEQKVFLDGRLDMYDHKTIEDYEKIRDLSEGCEELLDQYKIGWVIVPKTWPLVRYLIKGSDWKEKYEDDQLSILVRQASARP